MRLLCRTLPTVIIGACVLISGCAWKGFGPDWAGLYEKKLGQPIQELDEVQLVARLDEADRDISLIASLTLKDGSMLLLGLPPVSRDSPEDIVERSVVLRMDEAIQRCEDASGLEVGIWDSNLGDRLTNRFVILLPVKESETDSSVTHLYSDEHPHCELVFSREWRLNMVHPVGPLQAAP